MIIVYVVINNIIITAAGVKSVRTVLEYILANQAGNMAYFTRSFFYCLRSVTREVYRNIYKYINTMTSYNVKYINKKI